MKNKIFITILIIVGVLLSPLVYNFYWMMRGYLQPDMVEQGRERYRKMTSEYLIKKLHDISPYNVYTALDVLAERKEGKAVENIIEFLKSPYKYKRNSAMRALAEINDSRAIEPLMGILKKGKLHSDYSNALLALSQMQYGGSFIYIAERAKQVDADSNGVITMLRLYGKPEGVPLLLEIKKKLKSTDPMFRFDNQQIDDAIKQIELSNIS